MYNIYINFFLLSLSVLSHHVLATIALFFKSDFVIDIQRYASKKQAFVAEYISAPDEPAPTFGIWRLKPRLWNLWLPLGEKRTCLIQAHISLRRVIPLRSPRAPLV